VFEQKSNVTADDMMFESIDSMTVDPNYDISRSTSADDVPVKIAG
jgi:hypothetical protein